MSKNNISVNDFVKYNDYASHNPKPEHINLDEVYQVISIKKTAHNQVRMALVDKYGKRVFRSYSPSSFTVVKKADTKPRYIMRGYEGQYFRIVFQNDYYTVVEDVDSGKVITLNIQKDVAATMLKEVENIDIRLGRVIGLVEKQEKRLGNVIVDLLVGELKSIQECVRDEATT